jgi:hypothetical protein
MGGGRKSDAAREQVALLLAAGRSRKEAAATAGVARRSVTNWLREEAFQARVRELRGQLLRRTVALLSGAGAKAVKTLLKLTGDGEKANVRMGAADKLLKHLFRGVELVELAERVAVLEQIEAGRAKPKGGDEG